MDEPLLTLGAPNLSAGPSAAPEVDQVIRRERLPGYALAIEKGAMAAAVVSDVVTAILKDDGRVLARDER